MKRNLKLLSGILMASFLSNSALNELNMQEVKARNSRPIIVNSDTNSSEKSSKNKNSESKTTADTSGDTTDENLVDETNVDETTTDETDQGVVDDSTDTTSSSDNSMTSDTQSIIDMLNSDDTLTVEDIAQLALGVSTNEDFITEFATTFPDVKPLRKVSPVDTNTKTYLDVLDKKIKDVNTFLKNTPTLPLAYAEQNMCTGLLKEISTALSDLNTSISEEYPSTIFSLMPTLITFNDTFETLSLKYNSVMQSNYNNHVNVDILLKDVQSQLQNLLKALKDFKTQLPGLLETLNQLAETSPGSSSSDTTSDTTTDEEVVSDDTMTDDTTTDEVVDDTVTDDTTTDEVVDDTVTDDTTTDEVVDDTVTDDTTTDEVVDDTVTDDTATEDTVVEDSTASDTTGDIDPTQVILYFGESGQELVYDEEAAKYFEINPEDPNGEELIEYAGEVTTMTLADYLATELYFDPEGNELYYDAETDGYLYYNAETDEFLPYEGEVTVITMEEYLTQLDQATTE